MNRKIVLGAVASVVSIGAMAFTPLAASAQSLYNQSHGGSGNGSSMGGGIEIKAEALDMTTEQLREQLQTNALSEVISNQEMTVEQYHENIQQASQNKWQDMGLSEEEIQKRTQDQLDRQADCDGTGMDQQHTGSRYGQSR